MILPPSGGSVRTTERWDSYGSGTLPDGWKISHTRQSACFPGVSGTNTERYRTINHSFNAVWDSRAGCASSLLLHTQVLLKGSEVLGKFCLFRIVNFLLIFEKMVIKDAFNWVRIWKVLFWVLYIPLCYSLVTMSSPMLRNACSQWLVYRGTFSIQRASSVTFLLIFEKMGVEQPFSMASK